MKKKMRKFLAALLSCLMAFQCCLPGAAFAGTGVAQGELFFEETATGDADLSGGKFYLATTGKVEMAENGGKYILKVKRNEDDLSAKTVKISLTDTTAQYGKDYTVSEYRAETEVVNADQSQSFLSYMRDHQDELTEYNESDATAGVELNSESEGINPEVDLEKAATLAQPAGAGALNDSLRSAKQIFTGKVSDRVPMTGTGMEDSQIIMDEAFPDEYTKVMDTLSAMMDSAYFELTFGAGETEKLIEIEPKNDLSQKGTRIFSLSLAGSSEDAVVSEELSSLSVSIADDEGAAASTVSFTKSEYNPESGFIKVCLKRTGSDLETVSVKLTTKSGTARMSENFSPVSTLVAFPFGITERHVSIPISSVGLKKDADFKVYLTEFKGCEEGAITEATCHIPKNALSYEAPVSEYVYGDTVSGGNNAYGSLHGENAVEYTDANGAFVLAPNGSRAQKTFAFDNYDTPSVFYQGMNFRWQMKNGTQDDVITVSGTYNTEKTANGDEAFFVTGGWNDEAYREQDILWNTADRISGVDVDFTAAEGSRAELSIADRTPILRKFNFRTVEGNELQFIDTDGKKKPCSEISGYESFNTCLMLNDSALYKGDTVAVSIPNSIRAFSQITNLYLVDEAGKLPDVELPAATIKDNGARAEYPLGADYQSDSFWNNHTEYIRYTNDANGLKSGNIYLKATFDYIPVQVKVYESDQNGKGGISLVTEGKLLEQGKDEYGKYSVYEYHRGDNIVCKPKLSLLDGVSTTTLPPTFKAYGSDEKFGVENTMTAQKGLYYVLAKTDYLTIYPHFVSSLDTTKIKVKKSDMARISEQSGFLQDVAEGKAVADTTSDSEYNYYIYNNSSVVNESGELKLSALLKDKHATCAWTLPDGKTIVQRTVYYNACEQNGDSVITLSIKSKSVNDANYDDDYSLTTETKYVDKLACLNSEPEVLPAEESCTTYSDEAAGVSESDGNAQTGLFESDAEEGDTIQYTIECNGQKARKFLEVCSEPGTIKYTKEDGDVVTEDCLVIDDAEPYVVDAENPKAPWISAFVCSDEYGNMLPNVNINLQKHLFKAYISRDGMEYQDSDGVTRTEHVTDVSLVVRSKVDFSKKLTIPMSRNADNPTMWQTTYAFAVGMEDQYVEGDLLYLEITSDRVVGNGKESEIVDYDDEGEPILEWKDAEALQHTTYYPCSTGLRFVASTDVRPVQQDGTPAVNIESLLGTAEEDLSGSANELLNIKDLPFLGAVGGMFTCGGLCVTVTVDKQTLTISVGYTLDADECFGKKGEENKKYFPDGNPDKEKVNGLKELMNGDGEFEKMEGVTSDAGLMGGFLDKVKIGVLVGVEVVFGTSVSSSGWQFLSCKFQFGFTLSWRASYYIAIAGWPIFFGADVYGVLLLCNFGAVRSPDVEPFDALSDPTFLTESIHPQQDFSLSADISAYAGVGVCKFFSVRGGAACNLTAIYDWRIADWYPPEAEVHHFGFCGYLQPRVWLDIPIVGTINFYLPDSWTLPWNKGYFADMERLGEYYDGSAATASDDDSTGYILEVTPKARKAKASTWNNKLRLQTGNSYETARSYVLSENGYDNAEPMLINLTDGRILLVYVDDDKSKNDQNRTTLMYSVYDDGVWSEPKRLLPESTTAEVMPNICDAGDDVLISWVSKESDKVENSLPATLKALDIYTTTLNKKTLERGEIIQLTDDNYYNAAPVGVYDEKTDEVVVLYQKSIVSNDLVQSFMPTTNNCEVAYSLLEFEPANGGGKALKKVDKYYDGELGTQNLTTEQNDVLKSLNGQRFLNTNNEDVGMNDPLIIDYEALGYDGYCVYAYTIDEDNNLTTDGDRQLFLQLYEPKTHKTYAPKRVKLSNDCQSLPQLRVVKDDLDLFWNEGGKTIRFTKVNDYLDLTRDGKDTADYEFSTDSVFFDMEDQYGDPNFSTYNICSDKNGTIYVTWTQTATDFSDPEAAEIDDPENFQSPATEVFASSMIPGVDENGKICVSGWSRGVQLTDSGMQNDEQAMVVTEDRNLMVVHNQFKLDVTKEEYAPEDVKMMATLITPDTQIEATAVASDNQRPTPGDEITLTATLENKGLLAAKGYTLKAIRCVNGEEKEVVYEDEVDKLVAASSQRNVSFKYPVGNLSGETVKIKVTEKDRAKSFEKEFTPWTFAPYYNISSVDVVQQDDGFVLDAVVTNTGNRAATALDGAKLVCDRKKMTADANEDINKRFLDVELGALGIGESVEISEPITVPDDCFMLNVAFATNKVVSEINGKEVVQSNREEIHIFRSNPEDIRINGQNSEGLLTVKEGNTLELNTTFTDSQEVYSDAGFIYTVDDNEIIKVADGKLEGLNPGTANLTVTLDPYGGTRTVPVKVTPAAEVTATFATNGGDAIDKQQVKVGKSLKNLPIPQRKSYTFDGWYLDKDLTKAVTADYKPTGDFTLYAAWIRTTFTDVQEGDWFNDAVAFVANKKLMQGISETRFGPNLSMTRAMAATVLWRADGEPQSNGMIPFTDVPQNAYYTEAVRWAKDKGIVKGVTEKSFAPDKVVSREEMTTLIYRYLQTKDKSITGKGKIEFADSDKISDWAREAVAYCAENGIVVGYENKCFCPQNKMTRAEVATVLMRCYNKVMK